MTGSVAVVGSANLDVVTHADRRPAAGETVLGRGYDETIGGKGANQAIAAARVTATAFVGKIGTDSAGEQIGRALARHGVDTAHLEHVDGPSGRAFITVTPDGENSITVVPLSNLAVDTDFVARSLDAIRPTVVLTQCELPLAAVAAAADWTRNHGGRLVLNPSPVTALPAEVLSLADPLIVNNSEALAILGLHADPAQSPRELAEALLTIARSAVLTSGPRGAYVAQHGQVTHLPGMTVVAVDTTGAGDEFAGVLSGRLALGDALASAAEAANKSAAHIVTLARAAR